jgi:pimeloyl-ACP methyl ester carboxylesterase
VVADDWVQRMIDSPGRSAYQNDEGRRTHYLEWGDPCNPRVMLLLHGFLGHAHWWDFVAPWFAAEYRVMAIDFCGMGDSSHQPHYSNQVFVDQVGAVLRTIGSADLARHSANQLSDGYMWKFDEALLGGVDWRSVTEGELLHEIAVPLDFIAGELSEVVSAELAQRIGKALRNGRGPITIPSAYHHVPVNQPLALVAALRSLLI